MPHLMWRETCEIHDTRSHELGRRAAWNALRDYLSARDRDLMSRPGGRWTVSVIGVLMLIYPLLLAHAMYEI